MDGIARILRAFCLFCFVSAYSAFAAYSATEGLPTDYFLIELDADGDGRADGIFQPRTPGFVTELRLGNGSSEPNIPWQQLEGIDPDLHWNHEHSYVHIGDFNGDRRDDIYLQGRKFSSYQAVLLANDNGQYTAVNRKWFGDYAGFDWAADSRQALPGDFDGNGRTELLMRGRSARDIHLIMKPGPEARFDTTGPAWIDGHLGLSWNTIDAEVHVGDFNGDGRSDLLWRSLGPDSAENDDVQVALLLASASGEFNVIDQHWKFDFLGAEWDPRKHRIRIADITGDGIDDVVLMARSKLGTHFLVPGTLEGRFQEIVLNWNGTTSAEAAYAQLHTGYSSIQIEGEESLGTAKSTQLTKEKVDENANEVGALPGEFSVDPTGAANYQIPISVPKGVGGMQPDLAFLYSSRAGNGLLGKGWSLSGLSAITRCPRSSAQTGDLGTPVNFTKQDAFCLDGQLLQRHDPNSTYGDPGVIYGTELASFQRVESLGGDNSDTANYTGPESFVVKDKAGLIREYGATADSQIQITGTSVIKRWAVNKISDRFGNYIEFKYESASLGNMTTYQPKSISWHNSDGVEIGEVLLHFEDRPDITRGVEPFNSDITFQGSSQFTRLSKVAVFSLGAGVREYRIRYKQLDRSGISAIDAIQVCTLQSACLRPSRFRWSEAGDVTIPGTGKTLYGGQLTPAELHMPALADVNSDGRPELLDIDTGLAWLDVNSDTLQSMGSSLKGEKTIVFDYNSDGCTDVVTNFIDSAGVIRWHVLLSDCNGSFSSHVPSVVGPADLRKALPVDVDLNGYQDVVFLEDLAGDKRIHVAWNGRDGFTGEITAATTAIVKSDQEVIPIEYDGDGRTDLLITESEGEGGQGYIARNTSYSFMNHAELRSTSVIPIDWNGDGLTDLVAKGGSEFGNTDSWLRLMNNGGQFNLSAGASEEMIGATGNDDDNYFRSSIVGDWDQDGRQELIRITHEVSDPQQNMIATWSVMDFEPTSNEPLDFGDNWRTEPIDIPASFGDRVLMTDFNGDGLPDVVVEDSETKEWKYHETSGALEGLLIEATDGFGDSSSVAYSNTNRYSASGDGIYLGHDLSSSHDYFTTDPRVDSLISAGDAFYTVPGFPVVAEITRDTGVKYGSSEGKIVSRYGYAGAVVDTRGRGFMGFRMVQVFNPNTNMGTVNLHEQAFPFTGMIATALRKFGDDAIQTLDVLDDTPCEDYETYRCGIKDSVQIDILEGDIVNRSTSQFASTKILGGVFPYQTSSTEVDYQYPNPNAGSLPPVVTATKTVYVYNSEDVKTGDPTQISVQVADNEDMNGAFSTITDNIYNQNEGERDWCLGRLTKSTVTHILPDGSSTSKVAKFGYEEIERYNGLESCRLNYELTNEGASQQVEKLYVFDRFGNPQVVTVRAEVDGKQQDRGTVTRYDHYGLFPIYKKNDLGHTEHYQWDYRFAMKRGQSGPNGLTTTWQYDDFGRSLRKQSPRIGDFATFDYKWCGAGYACQSPSAVYYTRSISSRGTSSESITEFDSLQRVVATVAPQFRGSESTGVSKMVVETVYDSLGRPYLKSFPYAVGSSAQCWKHTTFDLMGRPLSESSPKDDAECATSPASISESRMTPQYAVYRRYEYDGLATRTYRSPTEAGGAERLKTNINDVMGRTKRIIEYDGSAAIETHFEYDAYGNTTKVIPSGGVAILMGYDIAGNKVSMHDPDMGHWTYYYNGFGELEWQQDALGNRVEMDYDKLGRMVERRDYAAGSSEPTEITGWLHDVAYGAGVGKPAYVTSSGPDGYTELYAYNEFGQVTDTVRVIDGETFWTSQSYDALGRPDITVYPDVQTFDDSGAMDPLTLAAPATSDGEHTVNWSSVHDVATYTLYRSESSTAYDSTEGLVYTGPLNRFDDTVPADGTYYYWIKACLGDTCTETGPESTVVEKRPASPAYLAVEAFDENADSNISLEWDSVTAADSYQIDWSADGEVFTSLATVAAPATSKQVAISQLADGANHFRIIACRQTLCSEPPTEGENAALVATVPDVPGVPQLPSPAVTTTGSADITWAPASDTGVDYYELEVRRINVSDTSIYQRLQSTGNAQLVGNLENGDYEFKVRACKYGNLDPVCGAFSGTSTTLAVGTSPDPIAELRFPTSTQSGFIILGFDNPQGWMANNLNVQESRRPDFATITRSIPVENDCGLVTDDEGNTYEKCVAPESVNVGSMKSGEHWYRIRAENEPFGISSWTETAGSVDALVTPDVPGELSFDQPATPDGSITVSWSSPQSSTVDSYVLEEATMSDFSDAQEMWSGPGTVTTLAGRTDGNYHYRVRACYQAKCSAWLSGSTSVLLPPGDVATFAISSPVDSGDYELNWSDASGNVTSYELQESVSGDFSDSVNIDPVDTCLKYDSEDPPQCVKPGHESRANVSGRGEGVYHYRVRGCNASGCGNWTAGSTSLQVLFKPGVPASISIPSESDGSHSVSWTSGSGTIEYYELYEADNADFAGEALVNAGGGAAVSKPLASRNDGLYYYRVRACNASGCSGFRSGSNAVVVTNLPGTPGAMTVPSDNTSGNYVVSWAEASGKVEDYELQESTSSTFTNVTNINVQTTCTAWYNEPLAPSVCRDWDPDTSVEVTGRGDADYYYRVRACNSTGCSTWRSGPNATTVLKIPGVPANLTMPSSSNGSHPISWDTSNGTVAYYQLYEAADSNFTSPSLVYSGPNAGTTINGATDGLHYYRVRACNESGCSSYLTGEYAILVTNISGAPGAMSIPAGSTTGDYTVSWGAASGTVEDYQLQESTSSSFSSVTTIDVPSTCVSWYDEPGAPSVCRDWNPDTSVSISGRGDGNYYYRVRACNSAGCSGWTSGSNAISVLHAPDQPGAMTVPSSSNGGHTVSWGPAGGQVASYKLYEAVNTAFSGQSLVYSGSSLNVTLGGRSDGDYYYRVRACNASGCSSYRTGVNPVSVLNVPGVPGSITVPANSESSHTISWQSANGSVARYQLYEASSSNFSGQTKVYDGLSQSKTLSGRADGEYHYRVRACNATGCSAWRTGSNATSVLNVPGTPSNISVPSSSNGGHTISWGTAGGQVASYKLYEADNYNFSDQTLVYSGSSLSKSLSGRADGLRYYRVRACNASGCSGYRSGGNAVVVLNKPGTPGSMSIPSTNYSGSYSISWNAASGTVEDYILQEATNSSFSGASNIQVPTSCVAWYNEPGAPSVCRDWAPDTSVSISNQADDRYYYRVRACNDTGCSGWRNGSNSVLVDKVPSAPSSISSPSTDDDGYYSVSWGSASGPVTHYKLYESTSSDYSNQVLVYNGSSRSTSMNRADGTYYYRVKACNSSYCSGYRSGAYTLVRHPPTSCDPRFGCPMQMNTMELEETSAPPGSEDESTTTEGSTTSGTDSGGLTTGAIDVDKGDATNGVGKPGTAGDHSGLPGVTDGARLVKVGHAANQDRFRAMPPQRPGDFYAGLRVGKPANASRVAIPVGYSDTAANDAHYSKRQDNNAADTAGVAPLVPLRKDARLQGRTGSRSSVRSGGYTLEKFGVTNEPTGTYAHAVRHQYAATTGQLQAVVECIDDGSGSCVDGQTYWEIKAVDSYGNVTVTEYGNGTRTTNVFDKLHGEIRAISTSGPSEAVQELEFEWDMAGNLRNRQDKLVNANSGGHYRQDFEYDSLNRLRRVKTQLNIDGVADPNDQYTSYHANGNIDCFKATSASCSGAYIYDPEHPHAVASTPASTEVYQYNANGGMVSGPDDRTITWTPFGKPARINGRNSDGQAAYAEFAYGASRERYRMITGNGEGTVTTTTYVGALYERTETDGVSTHRFHIFAGGQAIAMYSCDTDCGRNPSTGVVGDTAAETQYFHRDHLGSITAITNGADGTVINRYTYGAWGRQFSWNEASNVFEVIEKRLGAPVSGADTGDRGYTGHVMLSELGLIHMNGRIYDPDIGRFISADPFVQFPHGTQGYNRYSYLGNNPLNATDPSGYFSWRGLLLGGTIGAFNPQLAGRMLGYVAPFLSFIPVCRIWCSALASAASGYLLTGSGRTALRAGINMTISTAVGYMGAGAGTGYTPSMHLSASAGAIAGGALSEAGGGRFSDGFLGGLAGGYAGALNGVGANRLENIIIGGFVGGTVAKIGGGNFANGAVSGAFAAALSSVTPRNRTRVTGSNNGGSGNGASVEIGYEFDLNDPYDSPEAAAEAALKDALHVAKVIDADRFDLEVQGMIARGPGGKWFRSGLWIVPSTFNINAYSIQSGFSFDSVFHTHPANGPLPGVFSRDDTRFSEANKMDYFMAPPNGDFRVYRWNSMSPSWNGTSPGRSLCPGQVPGCLF